MIGSVLRSVFKEIQRRIVTQTMVRNEHFVPKPGTDVHYYLKRNSRIAVHHLLRYDWASKVLDDLPPHVSVIDAACGSGYGTHKMASEHPHARFLGVDYDPAAIRRARKTYALPNLEYRQGDVLRWGETIGQGSFDVAVSFDTLEHIAHREIMLENLVNHLQAGAHLLLSTPCGTDENRLQPGWAFHQLEFSSGSLYDFLSRYFRIVIRPDDGELPHLDVFDVLKGSQITYMLRMNPVICREPITIPNPYHR